MASITILYDDLVLTESVEELAGAGPMRLNVATTPKRHGGLVADVPVLDPRRIQIKGRVQESTAAIARETLDNMEEILHRNNKKFRVWDDRYIFAYLVDFSHAWIPGTGMASFDYSIDFICPNPFWISDTAASDSRTLNTSDQAIDITNNVYRESFTIDNIGSAFVYPVITVTAGAAPITQIIIRNITTGRTMTYSGTLAATKSLVIDCSAFTITNDGVEDLTNWSGSFLSFTPGNNSMQIEGKTIATYGFAWTPRYF